MKKTWASLGSVCMRKERPKTKGFPNFSIGHTRDTPKLESNWITLSRLDFFGEGIFTRGFEIYQFATLTVSSFQTHRLIFSDSLSITGVLTFQTFEASSLFFVRFFFRISDYQPGKSSREVSNFKMLHDVINFSATCKVSNFQIFQFCVNLRSFRFTRFSKHENVRASSKVSNLSRFEIPLNFQTFKSIISFSYATIIHTVLINLRPLTFLQLRYDFTGPLKWFTDAKPTG